MAAPNTLIYEDLVTHPKWPVGTTRHIIHGVIFGTRGSYTKSGYEVSLDKNLRYLRINSPVDDDDYWAEAGLEKVLQSCK